MKTQEEIKTELKLRKKDLEQILQRSQDPKSAYDLECEQRCRNEITTLTEQHTRYQQAKESQRQQQRLQRQQERDNQKQRDRLIRQQQALEHKEQVSQAYQNLIEQYDIKQIINLKSYYVAYNGRYELRDLTMLDREIFRFRDKQDQNLFHDTMAALNRNYSNFTFSFDAESDRVFNLAEGVREQWLKPTAYTGPVKTFKTTPAIDILLTSISGGDAEIRNHIEECVVRKYRNPGDYRIPSIVQFGQGGVGRNEFVEKFLGRIFRDSCAVTKFQVLTENAYPLLGKVCVLVDETIASKSDYEKYKGIAGNKSFGMKKLYSDWTWVPNVMWLFVAGNSDDGPLKIRDDSTTRRFSVIHYKQDLFYWLARHRNETYDTSRQQEYKAIWQAMLESDITEESVSSWLGWALAKFKEDRPVVAYHGTAYKELVQAHKGPEDDLIDSVIIADYDDKPNGWMLQELQEIYKLICQRDYPGRIQLGRNKFNSHIKGLAERGMMPGWKYVERQYWSEKYSNNSNDRKQSPMIVPENHTGNLVRSYRSELYISDDDKKQTLTNWLEHKARLRVL